MSESEVKIKIKTEIEWQFEELPMNLQSEWLWALAILGLAVVVFSVILKNYLLIIIIALTAFIIYASKNKSPELHDFKLDNEGLYINGKIYPYENFESFWIFENKEIAFRNKHHLLPILTVPFYESDESAIKQMLSEHLPESEEKESFLDLIRKNFFK